MQGLDRVLMGSVRNLARMRPGNVATLELDATCIESRKREAMPLYDGGRGDQPEVVYWLRMSWSNRRAMLRSALEPPDLPALA